MPSNDFLAWAIGASANVEAQATYAADASLTNGFPANVTLPSATYNKSVRQATFVTAAIAQFMVDNLNANVVDGGSISTFEGQFRSALGYASGVQVWSITSTSFDHYTSVNLHGSTSGVVTLGVQAAAGTYNWNYPASAGASGSPLLSGGGGSAPMVWGAVTGTGNFVLSASPTFTGLVTHTGMRTGTLAVNGGAATANGTWYNATTTLPGTGITAVFVSNSTSGDSGVCFVMYDSASGSINIMSQSGTNISFQTAGGPVLQVTQTANNTSVLTGYWTALTG